MAVLPGADPGRRRRALRGHPKQLLQRRRALARRGLPPPQALRLRGERRPPQIRPLHQPQPQGLI